MPSKLELSYSPKGGTMAVVMLAFGVGAAVLGYISLTEDWTPASSGMLRFVTVAAAVSALMCGAFGAILLRSKNWRVRVDDDGVSIDTLVGRKRVAWSEIEQVRMIGEGSTRGVVVTGSQSSLVINAMMMADPSQLERVLLAVQKRMPSNGQAVQNAAGEA